MSLVGHPGRLTLSAQATWPGGPISSITTASFDCSAPPPIIAHTDQPISNATVFNLFWDTDWNANNPSHLRESIDAATQAVIDSSYLTPLAEYGVQSVVFGGSMLPNAACDHISPTNVGFYDPVNSSIAGFVQCEHDHEVALHQSKNIFYNVILPERSIELRDFWSVNFCNGKSGSPKAWHFHGLENDLPPFAGAPAYSMQTTNAQCGEVVNNLSHEMTEFLTDPNPIDISIIPAYIRISTQSEIADQCANVSSMAAFNAAGGLPVMSHSTGRMLNKLARHLPSRKLL